MATLDTFKPDFDGWATDGCIGDPNGRLAYAYLRVSGREQGEEGHSGLPRQIQHCHECAGQKGYKIPWNMVFADDDTGFEFEHRPALTRLRREYKKPATRRSNVVIVEKLQRLSRNVDWHQGYLLDEMKKHGVTPITFFPIGSRIERSVQGAIDQDGMEQQKQYMRDGGRIKAESGRITARIPLDGYKFVDQNGKENTRDVRRYTYYAVNEYRAVVIRFIYDCLAYQDMSAYGVAKQLNERARTNEQFKSARGGLWWEAQIVNIVRNPAYKGEFAAYRHRAETTYERDEKTGEVKKQKRWYRRPEDEWIVRRMGVYIVDETTWELANKNLWKNHRRTPANAKNQYLLTGFVRCVNCDWSYHGATWKGEPSRYMCAGRRRNPVKSCPMPSVRTDILDSAVWGIISGLILGDRDVLLQTIDAKYNNEGTREILSQIAYIEKAITALDKEEAKEHKLYLADGYTAEEFADIRKQIRSERDGKQSLVARLKAQVLTPEEVEVKKQEALQLVDQARACVDIQSAPFDVKRKVLRAVVDEIILDTAEGRFEIRGALGAGIYQLAPQTSTNRCDVK